MTEELYSANVGLLRKLARRYRGIDPAVDLDDLLQAGYLGLAEAERTYDAGKGKSWVGWACWYAKKAMLDALGLRGRRRAHLGAAELDRPLGGVEGAACLADLLEDKTIPDASSGLVEGERRAAVRAAVGRLTGRRREVILRHDLQGASFAAVGAALGLSPDAAWKLRRKALNDLRNDPALREGVMNDE